MKLLKLLFLLSCLVSCAYTEESSKNMLPKKIEVLDEGILIESRFVKQKLQKSDIDNEPYNGFCELIFDVDKIKKIKDKKEQAALLELQQNYLDLTKNSGKLKCYISSQKIESDDLDDSPQETKVYNVIELLLYIDDFEVIFYWEKGTQRGSLEFQMFGEIKSFKIKIHD